MTPTEQWVFLKSASVLIKTFLKKIKYQEEHCKSQNADCQFGGVSTYPLPSHLLFGLWFFSQWF